MPGAINSNQAENGWPTSIKDHSQLKTPEKTASLVLRRSNLLRPTVMGFTTRRGMFGNGAATGIGLTTTRSSRRQAALRGILAGPTLLTIRWNLRKRSVFTAAALFSARINIVHVTWWALVARAKSPRAAITSGSAASAHHRMRRG